MTNERKPNVVDESKRFSQELHDMLKAVTCLCAVCQPPFEMLERDREHFSDLVLSGSTPDIPASLKRTMNLASESLYRAEELDFSSVEALAEDLALRPISENCAKIEKLAAVVRDAGSQTGFYGPLAADRVFRRDEAYPLPRRRKLRATRHGN